MPRDLMYRQPRPGAAKGRASRSSFTPRARVAISNMDKTSSIVEHLVNKGIRSVCPFTPPTITLLHLPHGAADRALAQNVNSRTAGISVPFPDTLALLAQRPKRKRAKRKSRRRAAEKEELKDSGDSTLNKPEFKPPQAGSSASALTHHPGNSGPTQNRVEEVVGY